MNWGPNFKILDDDPKVKNYEQHKYLPNKSFCEELNSNTYIEAIKKHYEVRDEAIRTLNSLMKENKNDINSEFYYYPDLDFISNFDKYISVKDPCLCNISQNSQNISVITDFGRGKIGVAKLISIKNKNEKYILKSIAHVTSPNYLSLRVISLDYISKDHFEHSPSLQYNLKKFDDGYKTFDGIISASGDSFANQTCLHMILNEILKNNVNKIENFVYQYDAFYCSDGESYSGYNIMEIADLKDLSEFIENNKIDGKLLLNILYQVLYSLTILKCKKYGFVHADLKCRNVFVKSSDNGPIFKIADFDKSSIFWKGIRFHTASNLTKTGHVITNYNGYSTSNFNNELIYSIDNPSLKTLGISAQVFTMFSPIPMYMSYDIYTFVYSLIREPKVWNYINNANINVDEQLKLFMNILRYLFQYDYESIINKTMSQMNEYNNISNTTDRKNKLLGKLRSLSEINKDLGDMQIKLKLNIDAIFHLLGLKSYNDIDLEIDINKRNQPKNPILPYHLAYSYGLMGSGTYHICVEKCKNGKCPTNKFSSQTMSLRGLVSTVYEEDSCINRK